MGRGKTELKRIENNTSRQVTFSKRRSGLIKKTNELSVLCDAQIGLIIFSSKGKLFEYSTPPMSMKQMIDRYVTSKGVSIPEREVHAGAVPYDEQLYKELTRMQNETLKLQLSLQRFTGDDLSSVRFDELNELEKQLEVSVNKVRSRKIQLLHEQLENLKKTEVLMEKENQDMYQWLMSNQMQKQVEMGNHHHHQQQQQAMAELKFIEQQPNSTLNQFPFFIDDLQLGNLQVNQNSFRLQPTHPNLQDPNL